VLANVEGLLIDDEIKGFTRVLHPEESTPAGRPDRP
jgi:hypothetical protein